jgi:hypothetical protein
MTLWAQFLDNQERVIHKWTHYFPVYERHLNAFVNKSVVIVEIGCGEGGSLQMWKRYLGPFARIVGIDHRPECRELEESQISVRIGEQQDREFLESVVKEFGRPDVVIDDGGHVMQHVCASFRTLYPRLSKNGVYVVEDVHTAYWEEYGGGLKRPDTFIELCKELIDELNAVHARGVIAPTRFTRTTRSIHFYDSIVVFERGTHVKRRAPKIGRKPAADPIAKDE